MAEKEEGLRVEIVDGRLSISLSVECLAQAAAHHPAFDFEVDGEVVPTIPVTDPAVFAEEVSRQLQREAEDGTTPVHLMLDAAMEAAVEDGCEGIDHDELDRRSGLVEV